MGDKTKKYGPEEKRAHRGEKNYHQPRNAALAKGNFKDMRSHDKGK